MTDHNEELREALLDALMDLWANIGPTEARQLQPETVELCQFAHEVREHGPHWTDWRHQRSPRYPSVTDADKITP